MITETEKLSAIIAIDFKKTLIKASWLLSIEILVIISTLIFPMFWTPNAFWILVILLIGSVLIITQSLYYKLKYAESFGIDFSKIDVDELADKIIKEANDM